MAAAMTQAEFVEMFPDSSACLDYLKERFHPDGSECPHCARATRFHRLRSRPAYSCQYCGGQVHPTAGTIFHRSSTDLQVWFWAIFLIGSTGCRISTRQLERELGVSYKTAQRMLKRLRPLLGGVEVPPAPPARPAWHIGRRQRPSRG